MSESVNESVDASATNGIQGEVNKAEMREKHTLFDKEFVPNFGNELTHLI